MELRLLVSLAIIFITPGAAILTVSPLWNHWRGLQRLIIILSLSVAFYPVLFYIIDMFPGNFHLGPIIMSVFFVICWILIGVYHYQDWKETFSLDSLEWCSLAILVITLFTRFWVAYQNPYPAWVDSVHHVMLTKLIATNGYLPHTLEPYYPVSLSMYHLGLHAIAAVVEWLAQCESHTALLWTAQTLNGLGGVGVYLLLDRKISRLAALSGAAMVGIFCYQPAFYVNWGRFTQIASQFLILSVWLITFETIQQWTLSKRNYTNMVWQVGICALLTAGMFLCHFRIAIFYAFLLVPSLVYWYFKYYRTHRNIWSPLFATFCIGASTLLFIAPALSIAIYTYLHVATAPQPSSISNVQDMETGLKYFATPLPTIFDLIAQSWILWICGLSALVGIIKRSKVVLLTLIWVIGLSLLGNLYLLAIRSLGVVNFSGVAIMFYLPIGIIVGCAIQYLYEFIAPSMPDRGALLLGIFIIISSVPFANQRIQQVEPYRFLMTEQDRAAMIWISNHITESARFAVNTDFWLPVLPHGTDAGYWLPYFTNHKITAAPMLANLSPLKDQNEWIEISRLVDQVNDKPSVISALYQRGVHYFYIGAKGHYTPGKGLDANKLKNYNQLQLLYEKDGVAIFEILPPN